MEEALFDTSYTAAAAAGKKIVDRSTIFFVIRRRHDCARIQEVGAKKST